MKEYQIGDEVYACRTDFKGTQCYWTLFKFTVKSKTTTAEGSTYNDLMYSGLFGSKEELIKFLSEEVNWNSYKAFDSIDRS
jgi:hypothetical protein